jgi:uncharacterized protein involved in exopolysaccharide biosynthesis
MIANRELTMDDYMAMLRRRAKVILIPTLLAPLAGFLVSYLFSPKYTAESLVLVEGQKVPETMVQPVVSEDLAARVATLQQQVLSQTRLQPLVEKLFPGKNADDASGVIDQIRSNMTVEPVVTSLSAIGTSAGKPPKPGQSPVPGFNVKYTASSAREAQTVCNELTSLLVDQNLKSIQEAATGTRDVLEQGIDDAKHNLDDMDAKLAQFKKQYEGQLPDEQDENLKVLMGLNTQLDADTQALNRAQQDKTFLEGVLAEQIAAWKAQQSANNPETLEKQLATLQSLLLDLQARYTDDHPDVIKTKADIAEVKKKLEEINKASDNPADATPDKPSAMEPPEIRTTRAQVHQNSDAIAAYTRDQKRLQQQIGVYQSRVSLSPAVEEQYKGLTRDYETALKSYQDLLAKKSTADLTVKMNNQSEGERMFPLNPAELPDTPSFPNRLLFAAGGLGAGLAVGLGLAFWFEFRDTLIRTEADAEAVLELPMLVAVPWVGIANGGSSSRPFWRRKKKPEGRKETVGV